MVKLTHKNRMGSDMAVTPSKFSLQSAWSYAAEHPKKAVAVVIALDEAHLEKVKALLPLADKIQIV
jgi:hypothetical protein